MELHTVPDALAFPSLRAIHIKVGDVLFIPGGSLICEKAINDVSLALKVYCPFMDGISSQGYRTAMKQVLSSGQLMSNGKLLQGCLLSMPSFLQTGIFCWPSQTPVGDKLHPADTTALNVDRIDRPNN